MCDELVYLEFASHVIVHEIWELRAAFDPAESAAFPDTAGNELECYILVLADWIPTQSECHCLRRVLISCPAAATPMTML